MAVRNYRREKAAEDAKGNARKKARAARNRARLKAKKAGMSVQGKVVNHKDGSTKNNKLSNLSIQTRSASNKQGGLKGRKGKTSASSRTKKR